MNVCHCGTSSFFYRKKKQQNKCVCSFIPRFQSFFLLSIFVCLFPLETTSRGRKNNEKKRMQTLKIVKTMVKTCCGEKYCLVSKKWKIKLFQFILFAEMYKKKDFFFCSAHVCGPFIVLTFCHWLVWSLLWLAMGTVVCLQWLHQQPSALNKCYLRTFCLLCLSYFI